MKLELNNHSRRPRSYVVLDVESAVIDETGHKRYQAMERWSPANDDAPSRRGYTRSEDPLKTPRWPFQTVVTAAMMVLTEHDDGNLQVARFVTLSAPDHSEREIIAGVLDVLADAPDAELVSWAGMVHDVPLLTLAAMRHGLTLPKGWRWLAFGGGDPVRHVDFARTTTGGFKMKPVHMAEILATLDIPGKVSVPAFAVARLIYAGQWDAVQEACEGDVISTALLLAHWRRLHDGRTNLDVAVDRILRQVAELRAGRAYLAAFDAHRQRLFAVGQAQALQAMASLAPGLLDAA